MADLVVMHGVHDGSALLLNRDQLFGRRTMKMAAL